MESIKELRQICQNKKKKEVLYFRIIRKFSVYFTKIFLLMGFSANTVSFLAVFLGFISIFLFASGNYWSVILGALILQFANTLDCCDGEIARYTKKTGIKGCFAEAAFHFSIQPLLFAFLAYGVFRNTGEIYILLLGFSAAFCVILQEIIMMMLPLVYVHFKRIGDRSFFKIYKKEVINTKNSKVNLYTIIHRIYDFVGFVYRYSTISSLILIVAILDLVWLMVIFYGITYPIIIIISYIYEFNKSHDKMGELIKQVEG